MALTITDSVLSQFACSREDDSLCYLVVWIYRVFWIFVLIGTVGNCLTLLVLSRKRMRKLPTSVYWAFLACSDLSHLWLVTFHQTFRIENGENIQLAGEFPCVMIQWLLHTTGGFSIWLLVLLTVERLLFTLVPYSARAKITTRSAFITASVTLGVLCLSNVHTIFSFTWVPENDTCVYSSEAYKSFKTTGYPYMLFIMYTLIPILVISAGNITIACKLRDRSRLVMPMSAISQAATRNTSATKMLFFVNVVFIISTLPYCVFLISVSLLGRGYIESNQRPLQLVGDVVLLLALSNFTFNFFLYCASGTLFREEFWKMVRKWRDTLASRAEPSQEQVTISTVP